MCSRVPPSTSPRRQETADPREEKIRYLFDTLKAINTPSKINEGPLRSTEFRYVIAHSVPLIKLKAQGTHGMPTMSFLELARKVKETGTPPPEKNTIGARMLVHGNKGITVLGATIIGSTEGVIERHAGEKKISLEESEREVFEALGYSPPSSPIPK